MKKKKFKKSIHQLAKENPDKTYKELEKYKEADRREEAGTCIMRAMKEDREK
jgi:hypothetical protein